MVRIIIDQRERNLDLINFLESKASIEIKTLPIGDYILSDRIAIERKTIHDFESSIMDGRLFDQIKRISEHYSRPIVIIEGDKSKFFLSENVILGAIIALYIDYNSSVITSTGPKNTAGIILSIAKHEQNAEKHSPSIKGASRAYTTRDFQLFVTGNLPGIGRKLAKSLLLHFKNIRGIANASIEDLMKVDKIGIKKAEAVYKVINEKFR